MHWRNVTKIDISEARLKKVLKPNPFFVLNLFFLLSVSEGFAEVAMRFQTIKF